MKSNISRLAMVVLCLGAGLPLGAQLSAPPEESNAPKVLMVIREQLKEGREAAHVKSEEAWPRLFAKINAPSHYLGMTAESGPSEAWFLEPYDSFGAMQKEREAILSSPIAPELEAANVVDGDLRTGSRTMLSVFRGDLSDRATEAMNSLPKCRFLSVTVLHIKYGHDDELTQAAASDQPMLAYQVVSGGASGTYLLFSPMDSLDRLDAAPARQALGNRVPKHRETLPPEIVQGSERLLFSINPRMSYVSKEFAAADPDFWNPKPKPRAK